ncbi:hypothetical protein T265_01285, partial [Opisthorchis viverrini]
DWQCAQCRYSASRGTEAICQPITNSAQTSRTSQQSWVCTRGRIASESWCSAPPPDWKFV